MASKTRSRVRNEVRRCPNCGEDYSVTYKRCPFCDESANSGRSRGGKRLNTRGGGYGGGWTPLRVISTLLSVGLIGAAIYIVVTVVKPLVDLGSGNPAPTASVTPTVQPTAEPSPDSSGEPTISPSAQPSVAPSAAPSPTPSGSGSGSAAQSLALSTEDFTLSAAGETHRITATLSPAGASGTVSWTSSKPTVATVAADGTVTAVGTGNTTITAALPNGVSKTCIVRCSWSGSGASSGSSGGASLSTELTLNRTDMTLGKEGETFTLRVSGASGTPTWSSSDTSVVSVSSGGTVTALKKGMVTISATVDGQTLKCIVRCNF